MNRLRALVMFWACSSLVAAATGAHAQTPIPPPPGSQPPAAPKPPIAAPPPANPTPAQPAPARPDAAATQAAPQIATAPPITTREEMEAEFDQFYKVGLDLERPLAVHNLKLRRDTMDMTLTDGTVWLAQPIGGRITGAYFHGAGSIKVTIPNAIDRKLFAQTNGSPSLDVSIDEAVLRFDDATDKELLTAGKPGAAAGSPNETWVDREHIGYNTTDLQMEYLENRLSNLAYASFFVADIHTGKDWLQFRHRGRQRMEDMLLHEEALGAAGKRYYTYLANFHKAQDYDAKGNYDLMPESDAKDPILERDVTMTVEIPNTKGLTIDARITIEAAREGVRGVRFNFDNNIDAVYWYETGRPVTTDLVADADGRPLQFLHKCHELLVILPKPLAKGEKTVVQVKATEDTIVQLTDRSYSIYTDADWYPKIGYYGGSHTIDWTVKIAKPLRATGTGDLVKEWDEGNLNCARWKSDTPVSLASFIFGDFKVTDGAYKRPAPGTGEVGLHLYTIQGGSEHFKGNTQNVLYNIGEGIKTYETIYGAIPVAQLDIAEMAHYQGFAQSPAGVLMVSSVVKGGTVEEDEDGNERVVNIEEQGGLGKLGGGGTGDQFVFHELAHQWWGHQIAPVDREDDWISESWAEYSAGMMIDAIDKSRFALMRGKWKQRAIEVDPAGTIATAFRSNSKQFPNGRQKLLYDKGPYVVHMLRTWMGWEKFVQYVSMIQSKYKGTAINTDTLAREASKVLGYDMFPFFDQWVRDKGIPKVHYSWSAASDSEGKQVITIKTHQEDAANPKILMVPIALEFGKGAPTVVPKLILKAEADIQLRVPSQPKSVVLDPDDTQLAVFIPDQKGR
jgi:hypothetical protein